MTLNHRKYSDILNTSKKLAKRASFLNTSKKDSRCILGAGTTGTERFLSNTLTTMVFKYYWISHSLRKGKHNWTFKREYLKFSKTKIHPSIHTSLLNGPVFCTNRYLGCVFFEKQTEHNATVSRQHSGCRSRTAAVMLTPASAGPSCTQASKAQGCSVGLGTDRCTSCSLTN